MDERMKSDLDAWWNEKRDVLAKDLEAGVTQLIQQLQQFGPLQQYGEAMVRQAAALERIANFFEHCRELVDISTKQIIDYAAKAAIKKMEKKGSE